MILSIQCRLPATVWCLSHPSAHVRTLSTLVLRDILQTGSDIGRFKPKNINGVHGPSYQYFNKEPINWKADLEQCLTCEARSRLVTGLPIDILHVAAKELGCSISL